MEEEWRKDCVKRWRGGRGGRGRIVKEGRGSRGGRGRVKEGQ